MDDDPKTFALLCRGNSLGVFQLESDGMRELLIKMQPEQFSDLIAGGPLPAGAAGAGMVRLHRAKHGLEAADYPLTR